jgi:hypothetical protein
MMPHFYPRLVLIPLILFTTALLLIHAQPYDDHELRDLLLPEGCPAPCFIGIRPGITNKNDALQILDATGWMERSEYIKERDVIRITWKRTSPAWLVNDRASGSAFLWLTNGIVNQVSLETNLMIGDIQLSEGQPGYRQISLMNSGTGYYLFYTAVYPDKRVMISVTRDCATQKGNLNYLDKVFLNYAPINTEAMFPATERSWSYIARQPCQE